MKKIAFCIPTYNRPLIVKEFIENKMDYYTYNGIDVYFYDSSDNGETERVIENSKKSCGYIKIDSNVHANEKVYEIFQLYKLKCQYDYIWLCGDSLCYSENAVRQIIGLLSEDVDILQLSAGREGETCIYKLESPKAYFNEWGWLSTLFGAVILNVNTMLKNVDWQYFIEKYNKKGYISFNHIGFYFEQLLKLKRNANIICLDINSKEIYFSPQKKRQGWYMNYYEVWAEEWINVIEVLPAYYDEYKEKVIKDHQKKTGRDNEFQFIIMRKNGILNKQVFDKYSDRINRLFDFSIDRIKEIANMSDDTLNSLLNEIIDKYLGQFVNNKIYIYGAGRIAAKYTDFFISHNKKPDGVIVSRKMEDEFMGIPVYSIDNLSDMENGMFRIVPALNEANRKQVLELLDKRKLSSYVVFDEEMDSLIRLD